jgi:hypothetical protein
MTPGCITLLHMWVFTLGYTLMTFGLFVCMCQFCYGCNMFRVFDGSFDGVFDGVFATF